MIQAFLLVNLLIISFNLTGAAQAASSRAVSTTREDAHRVMAETVLAELTKIFDQKMQSKHTQQMTLHRHIHLQQKQLPPNMFIMLINVALRQIAIVDMTSIDAARPDVQPKVIAQIGNVTTISPETLRSQYSLWHAQSL